MGRDKKITYSPVKKVALENNTIEKERRSMKLRKELLMTMGVLCVSAGVATAADSIQAYAHPTLFGSQGHALVTAESDVIVGGRIYKPCHVKTIEGKQNVVVGHYAKQMLKDMKAKMDEKRGALYDPKMPVLRSELAFLISEGLGLTKDEASKYTDLPIDAVMGIIVAGVVIYAGIGIVKDTLGPLLGEPPEKEDVEELEKLVLSYEGIIGIHDLVLHSYGHAKIFGSLHAEVPAENDILHSHDTIVCLIEGTMVNPDTICAIIDCHVIPVISVIITVCILIPLP